MLNTRRDIALLGLVHRTVLGEGPPHFKKWFFPQVRPRHQYTTRLQNNRHDKQLHDWLDGDHTELLRRSPLGLARVYNKFSQGVVNKNSVKDFQAALQEEVKLAAQGGRAEDGHLLCSPRREQWGRT